MLNYFTTLGADTDGCLAYYDRDDNGTTVRAGCDLRGAWDAGDLQRQQEKVAKAHGAKAEISFQRAVNAFVAELTAEEAQSIAKDPAVLGVAPDELRPIDRIGQAGAPVLVASGSADDRTPLSEAQALFERAPEPKRFWAVQGAGHIDLEQHDPDGYWREVLPFLRRLSLS